MKVFFALVLLLAFAFIGAWAERYEDTTNGFSIEIPSGWQKISGADLARFQAFLDKNGEKSTYVVGFKSGETGVGGVMSPYFLVQMLPYNTHGVKGQMTTKDIQDTTDSMANGGAKASLSRVLKDNRVDLTPTSGQKPELDLDRKRMYYTMEIAGEKGSLFYGGIMQFGRRAMYQPLYYSQNAADFSVGGAGRTTLETFELAPDEKWDPALDHAGSAAISGGRSSGAYKFGRVLGFALVGGLIGGIITLIRRMS